MAIAHYPEGVVAFLAAGLALLTMWGWLVTRYRLRRGGGAPGQVIGTQVRSGITGAPGYTHWTARHAVVATWTAPAKRTPWRPPGTCR